jgi:hypothetical protein
MVGLGGIERPHTTNSMSDLTSADKAKLQRFFEMEGGYVCNFTNHTFMQFVADVVDINIYDERHKGFSGSKASRLRHFWETESNQLTARLLEAMLEYWRSELNAGVTGYRAFHQGLHDECKIAVTRLAAKQSVESVDALVPNVDDRDFELLSRSLQESIGKGEFGPALDRLHTFVVKYLRAVNRVHGVTYDKKTPLNALIGGYVKFLRDNNHIETDMTMRILKSSIGTLEAFDSVRNEKSLAHDNVVLNKDECALILSYVASSIRFIGAMEKKLAV